MIKETVIKTSYKGTLLELTRRHYGKSVFTWMKWFDGKEWQNTGDPWPSSIIPIKDLEAIFGK
jgi:hypothetical protein